MAGLNFVTQNPTTRGWDAQEERTWRRRGRDQAQDTDTAIREGIGEMDAAGGLAAMRAPAAAPGATPAPQAAAAAPAPAQALPGGGGGPPPPDLVARVLFGEAGSEGDEGLAAAAHVIRNRQARTGLTPEEVVQQRGQFEAYGNPQARARIMGATPEQLAAAQRIWQGVQDGTIPDPTGGATHYLNPDLQRQLGRPQPSWAPEGQGQRIGRHVFYARGDDFRYGQPFQPHDAGGGAPAAQPVSAPGPAAPAQQPPGVRAVPANPYAPVLRRLQQTPGAGMTALNLMQRGENEVTRRMAAEARAAGRTGVSASAQNAAERNVLTALGRGEVEIAQMMARRIGMEIPPEILQNAQYRSRFAAASLLVSRHYQNSPEQAEAFLGAYLRTGDPQRALAEAGPPAGRQANWQPIWIMRDNQEILAGFNRQDGTVQEVAPPGAAPAAPAIPNNRGGSPESPAAGGPAMSPAPWAQPQQPAGQPGQQPPAGVGGIQRPPRGTGSPTRRPAREVQRDMLIAGGMDPAQANLVAGGGALSASAIEASRRAFRNAASRAVYADIDAGNRAAYPNAAAINAEIERRTAEAMAGIGQGAGGQAGAGQNGGRTGGSVLPAPQTYRLPDGREGRFVTTDRDGRHVYEVDGRRFAVRPAAGSR